MHMHIALRERNLDACGSKGIVNLMIERMNESPLVFRSVGPAEELEFEGGITKLAKSNPGLRHPCHQVIFLGKRMKDIFHLKTSFAARL